MKIFTTLSFLTLLLSGLTGCGKFDRASGTGTTTVTFGVPQSSVASVVNGGILVYAYSDNFTTNLKLNSEVGGGSITLPNGSYSFYAVGFTTAFGSETWDNDDNRALCAVVGDGSPLVLNGTPRSVNLTLSRQNCSAGAFTGGGTFAETLTSTASTITTFPMLNLVHCSSNVNLSSFTIAGTGCGWTSTAMWPTVSKYQVSMPLYKFENGAFVKIGEGFRSPCTNSWPSSSGASAFSEYKRVPVGITSRPYLFPVEIETFSDTACSSSLAVHRFHRGVVFGPNSNQSSLVRVVYGSTNKTWMYLREP